MKVKVYVKRNKSKWIDERRRERMLFKLKVKWQKIEPKQQYVTDVGVYNETKGKKI
jgi:hypothetical protein